MALDSKTLKGILIVFIPIALIITCNRVNHYNKKSQEEKWEKERKENEKLFHYSTYHSKYWVNGYEPNLIGAEGTIKKDEKCGKYELSVKIIDFDIEDKGIGKYEGPLTVKVLGWTKKILENSGIDSITTIDYNCFEPNFNKGEWLNGKKLN